MKHLNLDFQLITNENGKRKLKIDAWFGSRKTSVAIRTALSHVENLITDVTKGYRYKMRFVYAHFPINASIGNNKFIEIVLLGLVIDLVKDELILDGNDIELVSRSCTLINQETMYFERPLVEIHRAIRMHERKIKKFVAKKNLECANRLREKTPKPKINRIIRQRYLRIVDALRELDDCLTMVHLFAALPASESKKIDLECVHNVKG
ncbi:hypothetical protein JHK85_010281 [Glycine max]|nr:hypothetical protein JHK85_010281 [Glycine max]